jgi:cell pole-organizing protein PopZ
MGQAGAQREPSMEEILASIRRIIENNEPGPDGHAVGNSEAFVPHEADEERIDADYAEQEAESQRTAANDASVAQPVSLADVAARARATPDTHFEDEAASRPSAEASDSDSGFIDMAAERLREALTSEEPVRAASATVVADEAPEVEEPEVDEVVVEEPAEQPSEPETAQGASEHQEAEPDVQNGSQLVSLQTGEKVAAAFGELDAAIAAGQRRSFDEIAEEMLRPMLTQWLDDNLPTLVERLVREEIERVSRGNRR